MSMNTLAAYATSNFQKTRAREIKIQIEKAENGYIFNLHGEKELPPPKIKEDYFSDRWERFSSTFVFADLQEGLKEVEGFFSTIEKMLDKGIEARVK